jgi:hypothetical protein
VSCVEAAMPRGPRAHAISSSTDVEQAHPHRFNGLPCRRRAEWLGYPQLERMHPLADASAPIQQLLARRHTPHSPVPRSAFSPRFKCDTHAMALP